MYIKLPKKKQATSWEYLPDIDTLLQYLYREDLVELSQCCKRYRNQLEQQVLEKLDLENWKYSNWNTYEKLMETCKAGRILRLLKSNLDSKLKFIKKAALESNMQVSFAKEFNILLPNINTLTIQGDYYDSSVELGLITLLKGMSNLEIVKLNNVWGPIKDFNTKRKTFPKSIKSITVCDDAEYRSDDGVLTIYDNIDNYFTNLYSLSVVTNRMLLNLSSGMSNLREVEIKEAYTLKVSNIAVFLKANPQLEKLTTDFRYYSHEILQIILSFKYLKYWDICRGYWEGSKFYNLPSNFSIKYLKFHNRMPAPLVYQFTNCCKVLETLELEGYFNNNYLNWSKFERKIPILKMFYKNLNRKNIKSNSDSRQFYAIRIEKKVSVKEFIENRDFGILNNYKYIPSNSKFYILKLIN